MTYKFFVTKKCFFAMVANKRGVTYYIGHTYTDEQENISEERFLQALAYFINVHDGYIMVIE